MVGTLFQYLHSFVIPIGPLQKLPQIQKELQWWLILHVDGLTIEGLRIINPLG